MPLLRTIVLKKEEGEVKFPELKEKSATIGGI